MQLRARAGIAARRRARGAVAVTRRALFHYRSREGSVTGDKSLANCRDYRLAQRAKYEGLPGLRTSAVAACMVAIGRTWVNWGSFPRGDREGARDLLREMARFSRGHLREVMSGEYGSRTKLVCLLSQTHHPAVLHLCRAANTLRHAVFFRIRRRPFP